MTFGRLAFESVFADESGGNVKTPQAEYLPVGEFPVVDQGKALIGGYTNLRERLCGQGRPAIVFGDHTRCIKYIDFPFCMGADGVKVLRPKVEANLKYLYYFLKSLDIPSAGYDRHYKYLKRTEVVLPPLPEQRRIAAILDQADALRVKRREALAQLDSLTQSIFIEMFGDYREAELPWPVQPMEKIAADMTIGLVRSAEQFGPDFAVPYVRMNAISQGGSFLPRLVMRTEVSEGEFERYQLRAGDLLFNTRNSRELVGKTALFREVGPHVFNNNLMRIRFFDGVHPEYVAAAFQTPYMQQELEIRKAGTTSVFAICARELRTVPVPVPPLPLQQTFAARIQAIESLKATHRAALAESDALFASLQHRAFAGQLS